MTQINQYSTRSTDESSSSPKGSADNPYTLEEFNAFEEGTWPGGYVETMGYVGLEVVIEGGSGSEPDSSCSSEPDSEPTDNRPNGGGGGSGGSGSGGGIAGGGGGGTSGGSSSGSGNNGGNSNNGTGGSTGGGTSANQYSQGTVFHNTSISDTYAFADGIGIRGVFVYTATASIYGKTMTVGAELSAYNPELSYWASVEVFRNGVSVGVYVISPVRDMVWQTGHQPLGQCSFDLPTTGAVKVKLIIGYNYDSGAGYYSSSSKKIIYNYD